MSQLNHTRRRVLQLIGAAALLPPLARVAWAQAYPSRPIRWLVPFAAGGSTDIVARLIGSWLSERLGQTVIIENKPGACTIIATQAVVASPAGGYMLLFVSTSAATNATFYDTLPFNFLRDIAPVAGLVRSPFILTVNPGIPAKTVAEFVAHAKASPGQVNIATTGVGTSVHLAGELFQV